MSEFIRKKLYHYPFFRRNLIKFISCLKSFPAFVVAAAKYISDVFRYRNCRKNNMPLKFRNLYPCLYDYKDQAGKAKGHYFHQDILVARKIFERKPEKHYDIGSRIDGFIAHLLVFREVIEIDIRKLETGVRNLVFIQEDATTLKQMANNSAESVSALHSIEHFGLGRYGDKVNPSADIQAMQSLMRVLKPGGRLYFSVPVGRPRVEFNAHRVYDPESLMKVLRLWHL
jgi:SAM-dependent methyltransferase